MVLLSSLSSVIFRIGFWCPLYYSNSFSIWNPKIVLVIMKARSKSVLCQEKDVVDVSSDAEEDEEDANFWDKDGSTLGFGFRGV